jgi:hypothetical protein
VVELACSQKKRKTARSIASRNASSSSSFAPEISFVFEPPHETLRSPAPRRGEIRIVFPNRASHSRRVERVIGILALKKKDAPKRQDIAAIITSRHALPAVT